MSATNEIYQKCPLCSETFSKHELKSVKFNAINMPKIEKNGKFLYVEKNENNFENEKKSKILKNEKNGNIKKHRKDRGNSVGNYANDNLIHEKNDSSTSEFVVNDSNIDHNDNNDNNTINHRKNDQDDYTVQLLFIEKESLCPYLPSNKKNNSNTNTNKNLKNKKINSNIVMNDNIVPLINSINGTDVRVRMCICIVHICVYIYY